MRIPRTIVQEVLRHLTPEGSREFFNVMRAIGQIDEDEVVPFALGSKYEAQGLKPADAFIAAYTEWVGADILVSENRHFLSRQSDLPFKILSAARCLTLIS
ncbi:type II toxin-antitoxin system VapC family toxin [Candidatus Parcubacteria bacterium]|nr:type II toxin-antitoxin system VapC family toxin [Candidatus Parcubacteria bacterium]